VNIHFNIYSRLIDFDQLLYQTISPNDILTLLIQLMKNQYVEYKGDYLQWICVTRALGEQIFENPPLHGIAAPELRDSVCYSAFKTPLPNILPSDVCTRRPSSSRDANFLSQETLAELTRLQIEEIVCQYTLEPIGQLESRLRPGGDSEHGFLGYLQSFGQTVLDDAKTLRRLKIHREQIAERLELIIAYEATIAFQHNKESDPTRWQRIEGEYLRLKEKIGVDVESTWAVACLGDHERQPDPFHPSFDNPTVRAEEEYFVMGLSDMSAVSGEALGDCMQWPGSKSIRFSRLHSALIRRACFFEGPDLYYRLEPELTAKVLKLI